MTLSTILAGQVLGLFADKTQIIGFEDGVDLFTDESHDIKINKTVQPIETGSSLTDNAVVLPRRLKMTGYVSNVKPSLLLALPSPQRGAEAWSRLVDMSKSRKSFDILTTLELLEGYMIISLGANSNERTGTALEFSIEFEEIQFADSEFTTLPADAVAGGPAESKAGTVESGTKQSAEPSPKQEESLLSKILG